MRASPELSPSTTLSLSPRSSTTALSPAHEGPLKQVEGLAARRGSVPPPLQIPTMMSTFTRPAGLGPAKATLPRRRARKVIHMDSPVSFVQPEVHLLDVSAPEAAQEAIVPASIVNDPSPPPSQARPTTFVGTSRSPPIALRVVIKPAPVSEPVVPAKPARTQLPRRKARKLLVPTSPRSAALVQEVVVPAGLANGPSPPPSQARALAFAGTHRPPPVRLTLVTEPILLSGPIISKLFVRPRLPRRKTRKALDADVEELEPEPESETKPIPAAERIHLELTPITKPVKVIPAALETPTLQVLQAAAGLSRASEWKPAGVAPMHLPRRRVGHKTAPRPVEVVEIVEESEPAPAAEVPSEPTLQPMGPAPRGLPRMKRATRRRFALSEAESMPNTPRRPSTLAPSIPCQSQDIGSCLQRLSEDLYVAFSDGPAPAPAITQLSAPTPISAYPACASEGLPSFTHIISITRPGRGRRLPLGLIESADEDRTRRLQLASTDLTADHLSRVLSFLSAAAASPESRILVSIPGLSPGAGMALAALHLSRARRSSPAEVLRAIDEDEAISGFWKHVVDEEMLECVTAVLDAA